MALNEEQLRREFNKIDKNGDGSITVEELENYYIPRIQMLGISPEVARQEIIGLVKRLDVDNSGTIDFEGLFLTGFVSEKTTHACITLL